MSKSGPRILVVDGDWDERTLIASVLREAGFEVVATAHDHGALAVLSRESFAAAVIALPDDEGIEFLRQARCREPELKALLVVEPAALRLVDGDCGTLVKRPFDPRELLGCVFALVLREGERESAVGHGHVAEFGIAAARLACLHNRRVAAAAAGASQLAQDLARQIGHAASSHRGLAAVTTFSGLTLVR
jgi:DNA-binding response OmpR family regulator